MGRRVVPCAAPVGLFLDPLSPRFEELIDRIAASLTGSAASGRLLKRDVPTGERPMVLPTLMLRLFILPLMLAALLAPQTAFAIEIWCGRSVIRVGDPMHKVRQECGEPSYERGNQWMYDRGPGYFTIVIRFVGGKVAYIKDDGR